MVKALPLELSKLILSSVSIPLLQNPLLSDNIRSWWRRHKSPNFQPKLQCGSRLTRAGGFCLCRRGFNRPIEHSTRSNSTQDSPPHISSSTTPRNLQFVALTNLRQNRE